MEKDETNKSDSEQSAKISLFDNSLSEPLSLKKKMRHGIQPVAYSKPSKSQPIKLGLIDLISKKQEMQQPSDKKQ